MREIPSRLALQYGFAAKLFERCDRLGWGVHALEWDRRQKAKPSYKSPIGDRCKLRDLCAHAMSDDHNGLADLLDETAHPRCIFSERYLAVVRAEPSHPGQIDRHLLQIRFHPRYDRLPYGRRVDETMNEQQCVRAVS